MMSDFTALDSNDNTVLGDFKTSFELNTPRYPESKLLKIESDIRQFLEKKNIGQNKPQEVDRVINLFLKDINLFHLERRGLVIKGFSPDVLWDIITVGETLPSFISSWFGHARDVVINESDTDRDNPVWYATYSFIYPTYYYDIKKEKWFLLDISYDGTKKLSKQYQIKCKKIVDIK